jgi:hypothetical protein
MMVGMMVQVVVVMGSIEAHILVSQLLIADSSYKGSISSCQTFARCFLRFQQILRNFSLESKNQYGAGDEDRTRNFQLGKLTLYH